ncbi:MAG: hypothetical protein O2816_01875, partial [Planctomycetota bacterium]|nr:hypothetical protein [Planctomycetota bacterium]
MRAWILAVALALPVSGQQRAGSAQVDITPQGPTRLSGYGSRRAETAIVAQPLKATALAVGEPPVVVIAVDNCGVSAAV